MLVRFLKLVRHFLTWKMSISTQFAGTSISDGEPVNHNTNSRCGPYTSNSHSQCGSIYFRGENGPTEGKFLFHIWFLSLTTLMPNVAFLCTWSGGGHRHRNFSFRVSEVPLGHRTLKLKPEFAKWLCAHKWNMDTGIKLGTITTLQFENRFLKIDSSFLPI